MSSASLVLSNVTKTFDGVRAIDDLSIGFGGRQGIEGVIGPNGAGKTTLFRVISGFTRPDTGSVTLDGVSIGQLSAHRRARLGIARTFQEQEVFPTLPVGEVVTCAALMRHSLREAKRVARSVVEDLHLPWSGVPAELTPAEVRRLELARVEASAPGVVLFDEVMAGLTPVEADFMVERIRRMSDRGVTVVVVEHVMQIVLNLCSRVHVLVAGGLLTAGKPDEVAADPRVIEAYLGRRRG